ncbi:MAG: hypothetical protein Q9160_002867 [Pyrenula sp. 1 TL-2023]
MGADPPFIYDPPSRYSFSGPTEKGFNPKAATQASWTPTMPRPKQEGPLVNFNKHPDSYLLVPYGNLNYKPMSRHTKPKIKYGRQAQLFLRICELVGALGLLFCMIAIKGTSGSEGWIIRVAPAVALLHTLYAIYHLGRSPTGRTPASSSSYMMFAAVMDLGLLPFLGITAFITNDKNVNGPNGWSTLLGTPEVTTKIIYVSFLLSIVNGGLHLVSLIISVWLAVIFRKITKLPPDMNPLEDNLTARPHKRNKSELTVSDKRSSLTDSERDKRASGISDPLISPTKSVPFMHTRQDSAETLPIHRANRDSGGSGVGSNRYSGYYHSNRSFNYDSAGLGPEKDNFVVNANRSARSSRTDLDRLPPRTPVSSDRPRSARSSLVEPRYPTAQPSTGSRTPPANRHSMVDPRLPPNRMNGADSKPSSMRNSVPNMRGTPEGTRQANLRNSMVDMHATPDRISINKMTPTPPKNRVVVNLPPPTAKNSLVDLRSSPNHKKSFDSWPLSSKPSPLENYNPGVQNQPAQSSNLSTNWMAYPSPSPSPANAEDIENVRPRSPVSPMSSRENTPEPGEWYTSQRTRTADGKQYQAINQHRRRDSKYDFERDTKTPISQLEKQMSPLGMNPPTPVNGADNQRRVELTDDGPVGAPRELRRVALSDTPVNLPDNLKETPRPTVGRISSFVGSGGKSRFYGDLRSSMGSIHNAETEKEKLDLASDTASQYSQSSYATIKYEDSLAPPPQEPMPTPMSMPMAASHEKRADDSKGRVVSNSGYDLSSGYAGLGPEFGRGMGRRREVSGKVAEEGRSPGMGSPKKGQEVAPTAAGWARWKGL